MTPEEQFQAALVEMVALANDLSKWFLGIGLDLKQLGDPRAARAQAMTVGGAKAARNFGQGLQNLFDVFDSYINNEITNTTGGTIRCGIETGFVFTGSGPPETQSHTLTGLPWVTANTKAVCFPPAPATSAVEYLSATPSNYVPGVGFDIGVSCGSVTTQTYDVVWIAFPNGYTD